MDRYIVKKRATPVTVPDSETSVDVVAGPSGVTATFSDEADSKKSRIRLYKFSDKWKENREWLTYNVDQKTMFCTYCTFCQKTENKFVIGCDSLRLDNVKAHEVSSTHKSCHTAFMNRLKPPAEQPILKAVMNLEKHDTNLMKRHFTTAFYLAKHVKPYSDFVDLNELQQKNYEDNGDVKRHYNSDKQASNCIRYIAKTERDRLLEEINKFEVIAVAVDGATDSANLEQELFYVVYLDENFISKETYIKIVNVNGRATADGLSECFFETFREQGVDVHAKCVQLATDGPSVMKNMYQNLKAEIDWILHFHCINHRLELAVKDAVKDIPLQSELHSLLDGVYHFYDNSNLQQRILQDTAHVLGVNILCHPTAKGTRWVAHHERALTAMERNYRATTTQLHECHADNTQRTETRAKALGLRDKLINADIVTYMFAVLKVVLSTVSCLSCILQSNTSDVYIFCPILHAILLLANFINILLSLVFDILSPNDDLNEVGILRPNKGSVRSFFASLLCQAIQWIN